MTSIAPKKTIAKKTSSSSQKKPINQSETAGLILPVARTRNFIRKRCGDMRVTRLAGVALTALLESVLTTFLENISAETIDQKNKTIFIRHIRNIISKDRDWYSYFEEYMVLDDLSVFPAESMIIKKQKKKK